MNRATPDGSGKISRRRSVDVAPVASANAPEANIELVTIEGTIGIEVQSRRAPKIAAWVLQLVEAGAFDGTKLFRSGFFQGQPPRPRFLEGGLLSPFLLGEDGRRLVTAADAGLPVLSDWERTDQSGLRHIRGAVSLARDISGDGGALPELVIALEAVPELDAGGGFSPQNTGFPAFGRVVSGMDIVDAIARRSRGGKTYVPFLNGQILDEPAVIQRITRTRSPDEAGP